MGWKDWPYWLKCGLIFAILFIITIILFFIFSSSLSQELNKLIFFPSYQIREIIFHEYNDYLISLCGTEDIRGPTNYYPAACWSLSHIVTMYLITFIFCILVYFLIGALIGFIFGKFKSKSKIARSKK